ncbi:MAG: hypothetical protein A3H57_03030 [Candidatus Taylorbacteria bacterium RIFCSPLOWO2_02_FULL_43_11]|uniref:Uncharacterized protein n=1 Tax=Candidatus Taylorbacteria bacterium RIFCSPHIGHO2_02_FULL_43_32b TaxID=1802306 RepID=A0A1G2MIS5_9BACT|nr:MAG: hypothetical protein A2743_03125 [Candidatus Taylorbacteria bacterium RIFCSPHIGHO2_01_FULL_43_47]OHA23815.1 MAG: hypothetical protein A3C72_00855 [Candidatus Taylorbacteria bacterium RIFCSPHIGHO2_02_FULL_43_32b]OHA30677.1 MAG: hypothetical protein A3B08_02655 [Candidatus Taylorbacteria bacterium RIFCSPLOWO2_01_FULL_43_44]OHA37428.1 MAG: hypothetical protein A3H57_03030 [Candidatus Taylorbacteria bacterium RIFCSPLOWO2_02_FULL_43_11]
MKTVIQVNVNVAFLPDNDSMRNTVAETLASPLLALKPAPAEPTQRVLSGYFEQTVHEEKVNDLMLTMAGYVRGNHVWDPEVIEQPALPDDPSYDKICRVKLLYRRTEHGINTGVRIIKFHMKTFDEFDTDILNWIWRFQKIPGVKFVGDTKSISVEEALKLRPIRQFKEVRIS